MKDIELLGMHPDGTQLIFNDSDGERYATAITQDLVDLLHQAHPVLEAVPQMPPEMPLPSKIQSLIRSGLSAEQIAQRYGIAVDKVRRFEKPVLMERHYAAQKAQNCRVGSAADSPTLGDLVIDRLAARGVSPLSLEWDAVRDGRSPWQIILTFVQGATEMRAHWQMDQNAKNIVALDEEAIWLTETRRPGGVTQYGDDIDEAVALAGAKGSSQSDTTRDENLDPSDRDLLNLPPLIAENNVRSIHRSENENNNTRPIYIDQDLQAEADQLNEQLADTPVDNPGFISDAERTETLLNFLNQARGERNTDLPEEFLNNEEEIDYSRLADLANRYGLDEISDLSTQELAQLLTDEAYHQATANDSIDTQQLATLDLLPNSNVTVLPNALTDSEDTPSKSDAEDSSVAPTAEIKVSAPAESDLQTDPEPTKNPTSTAETSSNATEQTNSATAVTEDTETEKTTSDTTSKTAKVLSFTKRKLGGKRTDTEEEIISAVLEDVLGKPDSAASDPKSTKVTVAPAESDLVSIEASPNTATAPAANTTPDIESVKEAAAESVALPSETNENAAQSESDQAETTADRGEKAEGEKTISEPQTEQAEDPQPALLPGLPELGEVRPPVTLTAAEQAEADCPTTQAPVISDDQLVLPSPRRNKKKNSKRQSIPAWDDIVFGTKPH